MQTDEGVVPGVPEKHDSAQQRFESAGLHSSG